MMDIPRPSTTRASPSMLRISRGPHWAATASCSRPVPSWAAKIFLLPPVNPRLFLLHRRRPDGRDEYPSLHSDHFDFPDAALGVGMRMFVELTAKFDKMIAP